MWHVPLAAERKLHADASQQPSEDIDLQTRATFDCPASHSVSCFPPFIICSLVVCSHPPDDWHDSWMLGFFSIFSFMSVSLGDCSHAEHPAVMRPGL